MENFAQLEGKHELIRRANALGLDPVGVTAVDTDVGAEYFSHWLHTGKHGDMEWLARDPQRRTQPQQVFPAARSILAFGCNYYQEEPPRRGRIAKYALGKDYHKVVLGKLKRLCAWLQAEGGINRPYVDTGPLLEKPLAASAGLGWQGKNTQVLNPRHGQWLFLGFILTSIDFPPDSPARDRCGNCTRCIDVCPTRAITTPYQLDARRCIAYLTIELKGAIPLEFRQLIGDHVYGCDDCLDVCPWNRWAQQTREAAFSPRPYGDLREQLQHSDASFAAAFAGSPIRRLKRSRWLRNVAVVLGNIGGPDDLPALRQAVLDPDPMVREHLEWAIDQIRTRHPECV